MNIDVQVKPNSKKGPLVQPGLDGSLLIYVRELAIDGNANRAVVKLLADYYGVSKGQIKIISGLTSRQKRFLIDTK